MKQHCPALSAVRSIHHAPGYLTMLRLPTLTWLFMLPMGNLGNHIWKQLGVNSKTPSSS